MTDNQELSERLREKLATYPINGSLANGSLASYTDEILGALREVAVLEEALRGGRPAETAPAACSVLAGRFDNDCGEWVFGVVNTPLTYPFTHWWPLPDLASTLRTPSPSLTREEIVDVLEPLIRFHESGGHEGDGSDAALAGARSLLSRMKEQD